MTRIYIGKSNKLYIGNLSADVTEDDLVDNFGDWGTCVSARIIRDKATGCSRGFAFVEMATPDEAREAAQMCTEAVLDGQKLIVTQGQPQLLHQGPDGLWPGIGRRR